MGKHVARFEYLLFQCKDYFEYRIYDNNGRQEILATTDFLDVAEILVDALNAKHDAKIASVSSWGPQP